MRKVATGDTGHTERKKKHDSSMDLRLVWLFCLVWLVGCGTTVTVSPTALPTAASSPLQDVFRNTKAIAGWTVAEPVRVYDHDHLFDLVDGQAEAFFAYNFRQVAVQRYQNAQGERVDAEVWQLATPADAFGLFTASASGEPVALGNEGDSEPGRRLSFWQECYTVHVSARQPRDDAILSSFATAISKALPTGGTRPELVSRLPQAGLATRGYIYFRHEISIQDQVWLGGKNILGLGEGTDGVLGRYTLGGQTARLLLVQYSTADQATAGLQALQSSSVANLVTTGAHDRLLGAVLGKVDRAAAQLILAEALGNK